MMSFDDLLKATAGIAALVAQDTRYIITDASTRLPARGERFGPDFSWHISCIFLSADNLAFLSREIGGALARTEDISLWRR
jgi:hypothetical protein